MQKQKRLGRVARSSMLAMLVCVATAGCGVTAEPSEEDVGVSTEAVRAERSLPIDSTPQNASSEKPVNLIKGGTFKKTPPDRVEVLEGTYRTVGSRRFLLEVIKQSEGEYRASLVQTYRDVLKNISARDASAAQAELDSVLASGSAANGDRQ